MADGRVLYRDGDFFTIDVEKAAAETERACRDILRQL